MSSQGSVKPARKIDHREPLSNAAQAGGKVRLFAWARGWAEILLAELLNLLERRRYDLRR